MTPCMQAPTAHTMLRAHPSHTGIRLMTYVCILCFVAALHRPTSTLQTVATYITRFVPMWRSVELQMSTLVCIMFSVKAWTRTWEGWWDRLVFQPVPAARSTQLLPNSGVCVWAAPSQPYMQWRAAGVSQRQPLSHAVIHGSGSVSVTVITVTPDHCRQNPALIQRRMYWSSYIPSLKQFH